VAIPAEVPQQAQEGGEKRRRRATRRTAGEQPAPAAPAAARTPRVKPKPQALELIVGKGGEGAARNKALRGERKPLPSYLRGVK